MRMVILNVNELNREECFFRKKSLRNAVICVGWLKLVSVMYYVVLYFLVHANSEGKMSEVIQIMTLVTIGPQILQGVLLFMGALEEIVFAIDVSLWLCLLIASYNSVLGVMGALYFIRTGYWTVHFLLAIIFGILALSLYIVICHDILVIYAFKKILEVRMPDELE